MPFNRPSRRVVRDHPTTPLSERRSAVIMILALILGGITTTSAAQAKSSAGRCLIGVDITESVIGTSSPENYWGDALDSHVSKCAKEKRDVTVFAISSTGAGDYPSPTVSAAEMNVKDRVKAVRARSQLLDWLESLKTDTASSTDILSTLGSMSTELSSLPKKDSARLVLLSDGVQSGAYSFLKNPKPDAKYFDELLKRVISGGALHRFPAQIEVSFVGFMASSGSNPTNRSTAEVGRVSKLIERFWSSYFAKSSKNPVTFTRTVA
jgi:hypothetical protein